MAPRPIQEEITHSIVIHECGWYSKTHLGIRRVSRFNFYYTHLLTTPKGPSSSIISASSSQSSQPASSSHTALIPHRGKALCPERSRASARYAPCRCIPLFSYRIFSNFAFKILSIKRHKPLIATNFLRWTVLMLPIRFPPGVQHSRLSTNCLLMSSKLLKPGYTMGITSFPIPVCSFIRKLH